MDKLKMQTPMSPTPGADLQSLTRRTAGVSSAAYNVNRAFSPAESTTFRSSVAGSVGAGQGDRMSAQPQVTPTGASFGHTRPALARTALSVTREESPPKRPSLDRHADKAPWAGRSGSVRATSRLGDVSQYSVDFLAPKLTCAYFTEFIIETSNDFLDIRGV
jgi:hypothetical protein